MYKDATFKEKFADLQEWIPTIIDSIKKDLKNDHLKKDIYFVKKFFASKNIHKMTTEEMADVYQKVIQEEEKGEEIAEFIASRWMLKNSELYEFFEQELTRLYPDFTSIQEIEPQHAHTLLQSSIDQFGAPHTYVFSVLNSVVLPGSCFEELKVQAQQHQETAREEKKCLAEQQTREQMRHHYEVEVVRLTDKYEKKLAALQKKYLQDVESLKKQIASLQRKLLEKE